MSPAPEKLTDLEKWKLLVDSDINQAASEFGDKTSGAAAQMADKLGVSYMVEVVSELGTDAAADVLRNLPEDFCQKVLKDLPPEKAQALQELLTYKPGTAGALMAKEYLAVPVEWSIADVADYLQKILPEKRGKVSYIYAVDKNRRIEGVIQIRDLVFHPSTRPIKEILRGPVVQVETGMSQLDVARLLQRHRYLGLPVVNEAQQLVGVVSADNAMQAFEDKASSDIAKIVGTGAEEIKAGSVYEIVRLRLPWLTVNLVSGLACAWISGIFENSFPTVLTLFLFVPVVLGLSESIGVQGATIVVRNITLGNVSPSQLGALFFRETFAGISIGIVCGLVVGAVAHLWKGSVMIGLAMSASLALTVSVSALIGLTLPLIFKRLKIDPALASGPLVLAICDIQTLLVYFNLSSLILKA